MSRTTNRFSAGVRARAVGMLLNGEGPHGSRWRAIVSIAAKVGRSANRLNGWVKKAGDEVACEIGLHRESGHMLQAHDRMNWEQGTAEPPVAILRVLREKFDVDPEWVVSGEDTVPRRLSKPIDWVFLETIERDVRFACRGIGLDLTAEQRQRLMRALYDEGQEAYASNGKRMHGMLQALMKEG